MPKRNNKANNKQTTKKNPNKEFLQKHWGTLANLLMTLIAGVIIVIYLQKDQQKFEIEQQIKNEEFQKQYIDFQSKSELSSLGVKTEIQRHQKNQEVLLYVKNTGPATAKNINISFCIDYITKSWEGAINSIDQFEFINEKASIKMSSEITESPDCFREGTSGFDYAQQGNITNNSILLSFSPLPPNEELILHIRLKNLETQDVQYDGDALINLISLITPTDANTTSSQGINMDYIQNRSLDQSFFIAKLNMGIACENCNTTFKSVNQDVNSIYIPSWVSADWKDLSRSEDDLNTKLQFKVGVSYKIPENSTKIVSGSPVTFKVMLLNDENQNGDIIYIFLPSLENLP